ncbi:MAG: hypothetical protein RSF42_18620 [Comamonas sp.]
MTQKIFRLGLAGFVSLAAAGAFATPLTLENNWIQVGISDYATLGSNKSATPGILYDPTGTQTYGNNDFLTPGTPHELFTVQYTRDTTTFSQYNNNVGIGNFSPNTLTQISAAEVTTSGASSQVDVGNVAIKHDYALNTDGTKHQIAITTTVTNNGSTAMTGVKFLRSLDPDPDVNNYNSYATDNNVISSTQVCATGIQSNQTICLLSNDTAYPDKIAGITPGWTTDPDSFLQDSAGQTQTTGDHSIGLYIALGDIAPGASKTVTYSYLLASTLVQAVTPTISVACTPGNLMDSANQKAICTLTSDTSVPAGGISVNLDLGSTGAASRYTSTCTSPIAMAAASTTATCEIVAADNSTASDGNLDVNLTVLAGTGYNPSTTAYESKVTIQNDDALLSIACAPNSLTDSAGQVSTCTITSDMPAPAAGLPFTVQANSTGAAARSSSTCTTPQQIAAGATSTNCTITATDNTVVGDGNLSVLAAIQPGAGYEASTTQGSAAVSITDDDVANPALLPALSVNCIPSTLNDSAGQTAICTITADKAAPAAGLSVKAAITSQMNTGAGRFTTTCDAPLSIAAGGTSATCEISAVANTVVGDGNVLVTMALQADPSYSLATAASATVTVMDDDTGTTTPRAVPVPTLGVWGLISLSLTMLAGFAVRRRGQG